MGNTTTHQTERPTAALDKKFGERIRSARLAHDWTIRELSAKVGCSTTHLTRIELGRRHVDSTKLIIALANVLNIPVDELMELNGQNTKQGSFLRIAIPSIRSELDEKIITSFSILVTSTDLTKKQAEHLLTQCRAFIEYCQRQNS